MMGFITDHTIEAPKWKKGNTGFGATLLGGDPALCSLCLDETAPMSRAGAQKSPPGGAHDSDLCSVSLRLFMTMTWGITTIKVSNT